MKANSYKYDIVIASPNSAIDSYYVLDKFRMGSVNRASLTFHTAGGKGHNMARALKTMGGEPLSIGIAGGGSGHFIASELDRENLPYQFIWSETESRRLITFSSPDMPDSTTILEPGKAMEPVIYEQFANKIFECHMEAPWLALIGSLPPDCPNEMYGDIITQVKTTGGKVAIDCSGKVLQIAINAGPALIKINRAEFYSTFQIPEDANLLEKIGEIYAHSQSSGLEMLIITDGSNGAIAVMADNRMVHIKTTVPSYVSTAGAGDTFLAALLLALNRDTSFQDSLIFASAASAANLQKLGCGFFDPELIEQYKSITTIEPLTY